jgi:hypothetical protein
MSVGSHLKICPLDPTHQVLKLCECEHLEGLTIGAGDAATKLAYLSISRCSTLSHLTLHCTQLRELDVSGCVSIVPLTPPPVFEIEAGSGGSGGSSGSGSSGGSGGGGSGGSGSGSGVSGGGGLYYSTGAPPTGEARVRSTFNQPSHHLPQLHTLIARHCATSVIADVVSGTRV